jgi:hypothetical protein
MKTLDKEVAPQELPLPGTWPTAHYLSEELTVDTTSIREPHPKVPSEAEKRLEKLEERYRHELMDDEERLELRDRVLALRRRLGR